jgi:hypothetical protein
LFGKGFSHAGYFAKYVTLSQAVNSIHLKPHNSTVLCRISHNVIFGLPSNLMR